MPNKSPYETYLFLSNKSFFLCVIQITNSVIVCERKISVDQDTNQLDYEKLYNFLDNNIYKIEKKLKHFIKDINIILEIEEFFPIEISIKDNNNGNVLYPHSLIYSLNEAKKLCDKNFEKNRIIHMLIDNYQINNKVRFSYFPQCFYIYIVYCILYIVYYMFRKTFFFSSWEQQQLLLNY